MRQTYIKNSLATQDSSWLRQHTYPFSTNTPSNTLVTPNNRISFSLQKLPFCGQFQFCIFSLMSRYESTWPSYLTWFWMYEQWGKLCPLNKLWGKNPYLPTYGYSQLCMNVIKVRCIMGVSQPVYQNWEPPMLWPLVTKLLLLLNWIKQNHKQ